MFSRHARLTPLTCPLACLQLALERAGALLDYVVAGSRPSYDDVRGELAQSFKEAGLTSVADFITATS